MPSSLLEVPCHDCVDGFVVDLSKIDVGSNASLTEELVAPSLLAVLPPEILDERIVIEIQDDTALMHHH